MNFLLKLTSRVRLFWSNHPTASAAGVLAVLTLTFYSRILFTNRAIIPWDAGDFFYPLLGFVHEELRHLRLPLWNPFNFAGFPVIADPEAQIFYPVNWLMTLAGAFQPLSYRLMEVQIVAHYFLAGIGMYWLVKDWTGKHLPALMAGVIYMFSGPLTTHAQHQSIVNVLGWYPVVFLFARRALLRKDPRAAVIAGVLYGLVCLTGHYQTTAYLALFLFLFFAYEACFGPDRRSLWPQWMIQLGLIGLIGIGLAMIQLLLTAELSELSIRSQLVPGAMAGSRDPLYLWTYFLPNFFGEFRGARLRLTPWTNYHIAFISVPGCILALVGIVEMARRRNLFWLASIILFSLASLGTNGPLFHLVYSLPVLKLFRNMFIFISLAIFSAAVMAGIGGAALEDAEKRSFHLRWLRVFAVVAFAFAVAGGYWQGWIQEIPHYWYMLLGLGIVTAFLLVWPRDLHKIQAVQWTLLALAVAELFNFHMNKPFNAERQNPQRFMSYDYLYDRREELTFLRADTAGDFRVANATGWPSNHWNLVRIPSTYGWNPVILRRYNEYVRQFMQTSMYAFADAGPDHNLESPMQDLLGIKYYLTISIREEEMQLDKLRNLQRVYSGTDWFKIYRNLNYVSRAWMFDRAYVVPNNSAVLALMNSRWFQARKSLILERRDVPANSSVPIEELPVYVLPPAQESSTGDVIDDALCAEPRRYRAYWGSSANDWQRFPLPPSLKPGKYLVSAEYFTLEELPRPVVVASLEQDHHTQTGKPIDVLRTSGTHCAATRTVDLGTFDITDQTGSITLTAQVESQMSVYGLTLVRLPNEPAVAENGAVSNSHEKLRDFDVSQNHYAFTVDSPEPAFVLINEIYYPGWKATIDGHSTGILRGDSIFRVIEVPAGNHRVEMNFVPRRLWWGGGISALTLAGVLIFLWRRRTPAGPTK